MTQWFVAWVWISLVGKDMHLPSHPAPPASSHWLHCIPQAEMSCLHTKDTHNWLLSIYWNTYEFCSKPYCGALIPQSVNRHLDAGRLINFFIWQSPCCQLHTSVPARDKITFPIKSNTHASAFLLGRFPPQSCGVVYYHVLKSLRLDVVPDVVPHAAQPVLKTRHSLGPPMVVTLDTPACCPADLEVREEETCMWAWRSMCCPEDCTVLSGLAGVLNVQPLGACSCWPTSCSIVSKQGLLFTAGRRFDVVPDVVLHAALQIKCPPANHSVRW